MVKIYCVSHKPINLECYNLPSCYKKIRVGNYSELHDDEISDNTGKDEISKKNPYYCELTALYWIWKNDDKSNYIGLCHYRRFFTKYAFSNDSDGFISDSDVQHVLRQYDVILPYKSYFWKGCKQAFLKTGYEKDLILTGQAIRSISPELYSIWEDDVINGAGNYLYNMCVMSSENMKNYCAWLFSILEYVEERIDLKDYSDAEKRVFGYLSERLLGVWIKGNNMKVKHMRVVNVEKSDNTKTKLKQLIKYSKISDGLKVAYFGMSQMFSNLATKR